MNMKRKKRKKSKQFNLKTDPKVIRKGSFILFIFLLFAGLGYTIYVSEAFVVKARDIKSNIALGKNLIEEIKSKSLFNLNIKEISSCLLEKHSEYKEVCVTKKFPSTVFIEIKKRFPSAQIKGKKFFLIDREGVVLDSGSVQPYENFIPVEISSHNRFLQKGYNIKDERLKYAFDLIDILGPVGFSDKFIVKLINSTHPRAIYFIVDYKSFDEGKEILTKGIKIILEETSFREKMQSFRKLIDGELKDKMSLLTYVDLRHKKVYAGFRR